MISILLGSQPIVLYSICTLVVIDQGFINGSFGDDLYEGINEPGFVGLGWVEW